MLFLWPFFGFKYVRDKSVNRIKKRTIRAYKSLSQKITLKSDHKNKISAYPRKYRLILGSSCLALAFLSESRSNMQRPSIFDCRSSPKLQKIKRNQWPLAKQNLHQRTPIVDISNQINLLMEWSCQMAPRTIGQLEQKHISLRICPFSWSNSTLLLYEVLLCTCKTTRSQNKWMRSFSPRQIFSIQSCINQTKRPRWDKMSRDNYMNKYYSIVTMWTILLHVDFKLFWV